MPTSLKLPYTQQFAPVATPLDRLLAVIRQHNGDCARLGQAIGSAFFKTTKTPLKMAGNTLIALKYHGIVSDACSLTEFGKQLVGTRSLDQAKQALAKNILLNLNGLHLIQTLREMRTAGIKCTLNSIHSELAKRGFEVNDNSSDLSGVLNWLREAGILREYDVDEEAYAALVGTTPKTLDSLKDLSREQIAFLRSMVMLSITDVLARFERGHDLPLRVRNGQFE